MKNIVKGLLVAGAVVGASTAVAGLEEVSPYVGGEYEWSSTRGADSSRLDMYKKSGSLKDFYPKSYSGANFFVGGRWCDFGVEAGYTFTGKKSKTQKTTVNNYNFQSDNAFYQFNNYSINSFLGLVQGDTLKTTVKFTGWHIDLNGYLPLYDCWELIGSVGYGWMKPKMSITGTHVTPVAAGIPASAALNLHSKYKGMFRLGVGTQYMVTECVGLRGMLRWKNTEKLSVKITNANPNVAANLKSVTFKPFKDTLSLAAGVFVKF